MDGRMQRDQDAQEQCEVQGWMNTQLEQDDQEQRACPRSMTKAEPGFYLEAEEFLSSMYPMWRKRFWYLLSPRF
jgi:hypothetical protein